MATETKRVYDLEVKGAESINDLKNSVEQLTEKLKTLNETSQEYKATLEELTKLQSQLADAMNGIGGDVSNASQALNTMKEATSAATENLTNMSQASEKTKESLNSIGEVTTIKDLRAEIKSLKDQLYTLQIGSDDYKDVAMKLANEENRLKDAMAGVKTSAKYAEGSYKDLSNQMRILKDEYHATNDEARRNELAPQIAKLQQTLKDMDAAVLVYGRNVGNYSSALDGLSDSFVSLKTQLKEAKEAMQQADPASQAYADALAKAADITHQLSEQQQMIKYSSADVGDQLENVRGIASNMAAGYSALNAAMGLMGEESDGVKEAMLKVQQAMALVQGLQGMEGLIKRTQGLSNAMKIWINSSRASAAATKADAAASAADAAAKGAEATATAGAVAPQLALNAAMAANPIGVILTLIGALIAIFMIFKEKIKELIGSNKEMSAAFDKVKAVLSGFGNVIKKSIINPIKLAIIPIKTLAKVMIDLFKGDWAKIGEDIKAGMEETKDVVVDTINVVGAFKEGYDKKTAEQNEAARKKEAEARSKELDGIIKDNEAKYKSDWKYTEAGKKAYEEYFKSLLEMYDKDTDEYKQALRDKEAYLNDFNEKQKENTENMAALELKLDVAKYGEQVKYGEKWYNYEKSLYDKAMKLKHSYAYAYAVGKVPDEIQKQVMEAELRWEGYLNERNNYYKKSNDDFKKQTSKLLSDFKSKFDSLVNDSDKALRNAQETANALTKTLKVGGSSYQAIEMYLNEWRKLFKELGAWDESVIESKIERIRTDITSGAVKNAWESYVKSLSTVLDKEIYNMDKTVKSFVGKLQQTFDENKIEVGIEFPEGEIEHIESVYGLQMDNAYKKTLEVEKEINFLFETLASQFSATTKEELGAVLPEFQKLLDAEQNYINEYLLLKNERFKKESDIWAKDWENRIKLETNGNEETIEKDEHKYNELINNAKRWQGVYGNILRDLYEDKSYITESYNTQKKHMEKLKAMYDEMAEDEKLTFEEKEKAKRESAALTFELTKLNHDKEIEMLKIQKNLWKEWANAVKDSISSVSDTMSSIADSWSGIIELEQTSIQTELEAGNISQAEAERRDKENEESFNRLKAFQIAQTIINGLSGAISAYQSMAGIPYVGPVLGAAAAAAVAAATAVNVAKIKATQYQKSSSSTSGGESSSTNFQLPNVMDLEPSLGRNNTSQNNIDNINNDGSGFGKDVRVVLVESDVTIAQDRAKKVQMETTF